MLDHLVHAVRIATVAGDRRAAVPGLLVAEPEKALCDLLWLCESRGFAVPVESLRLDDLRRDRLEAHAKRMGLDLSVLE